MAGITDLPFRIICKEHGCDLTVTEMVSAKGLHYGNERTGDLLRTDPREAPCVTQIFGSDAAIMADMAKRLEERYAGQISGIDINMGCPAPKITSNGDGSALMRDIPKAANIIRAVSGAVRLPVSVKFRKGYDGAHVNAVELARAAEENGAAWLTVHGRTRDQMYSGKADRDIIAAVKAAVKIPVVGNGDIVDGRSALDMLSYTHCDGLMIGRAAQGCPFIFEQVRCALEGSVYQPPTPQQRCDTLISHIRLHCGEKGDWAVVQLRKHMAWYVTGLPGAAAFRVRVNELNTAEEMIEAAKRFFDGAAHNA